MRATALTIAFGSLISLPATLSLPWNNASLAVVNTISDLLGGARHGKGHETGPKNKTIPGWSNKCLGDELNQTYYMSTKQQMIEWSNKGGRVAPGYYHAESSCSNGMCSDEDVTWYICNCKFFWPDPVPQWELDEVQSILQQECGGPWKSGSFWSKKWQKMYTVVPEKWFIFNKWNTPDLCPAWCIMTFKILECLWLWCGLLTHDSLGVFWPSTFAHNFKSARAR